MTATATTSIANKPGVWYFIYVDYCVMCGRTEEVRERRKGPKPEDPGERYSYKEHACYDHFL